jgi:uncharacterized membrane protein
MSPTDGTPPVPQVRREHREEARLNAVISRVLVVGLLTAMALLAIGVILTIARPDVPIPDSTSVRGMRAQLAALDPGGFYELGLMVLLLTPFARVVALGISFTRRREWLFAGISAVVAAMLMIGAVLGLSLG